MYTNLAQPRLNRTALIPKLTVLSKISSTGQLPIALEPILAGLQPTQALPNPIQLLPLAANLHPQWVLWLHLILNTGLHTHPLHTLPLCLPNPAILSAAAEHDLPSKVHSQSTRICKRSIIDLHWNTRVLIDPVVDL
jgi:hypothetical protein